MEGCPRSGDRFLWRIFRQGKWRRRADDQRDAAWSCIYGPDPCSRRPVPCPGSGNDSSCFQYVSRSCNGIYGNGHGTAGRRHQCAEPVCDGAAATDGGTAGSSECSGTAGSGSTEDGSSCRGLEMQLRHSKHRQILCRMRSAQACWRYLDLQLRCSQQRQILFRMRKAQTGCSKTV